jgi:class 3 adenylate cyclase
MAQELAVSQERSKRISRLKRFLAPQVAEIVDRANDDGVLDPQRQDVAAVFGDLRGFTAFSAHATPEEVMAVLGAYYEAIGTVIAQFEATLTNLSGDGVMILVNAPVPRADPALHAVRLAMAMQEAVQRLAADWRAQGYAIGFGVGLAYGSATVGQVGSGSRLDYTAIGPVVNLAARLCAAAKDGEMLLDASLAASVGRAVPLRCLGRLSLKGFDQGAEAFAVMRADPDAAVPELQR